MSRNVPNVNASLIREIRMVVQQFFRHKENASFWAPKAAPVTITLKCAFCVDPRKRPLDAHTVVSGYAVCPAHVRLVTDRDDKYADILNAIRSS